MSRYTFEEIVTKLDLAITNKHIYNQDLIDLKFYIGRMFDDERSKRDVMKWDELKKLEFTFPNVFKFANDWPFGMASLNRFARQVAKAEDHELTTQAKEFVARWQPVEAKLQELKPFVIKGRRPSENPRKTPERTLDNTGTCPICSQNVKLDGEGMYHHGFELRYNTRNGSCFGTAEKPVEVSPEGMQHFVEYLTTQIEQTQKNLDKLLANPTADLTRFEPLRKHGYTTMVSVTYTSDHKDFQKVYQGAIRERESSISHDKGTRAMFNHRIKEWAPKPLPGDRK